MSIVSSLGFLWPYILLGVLLFILYMQVNQYRKTLQVMKDQANVLSSLGRSVLDMTRSNPDSTTWKSIKYSCPTCRFEFSTSMTQRGGMLHCPSCRQLSIRATNKVPCYFGTG